MSPVVLTQNWVKLFNMFRRYFHHPIWRAIALAGCVLLSISLISTPIAHALTQIKVFDLDYQDCPSEFSEGVVLSGSSQEATCFLITGKAENPTNKTIYSADVFGRIFDANHNPVMQNRTRLGLIDEVPPGVSSFQLRISVASNQPTPLQLEQFKASGFASRIRR